MIAVVEPVVVELQKLFLSSGAMEHWICLRQHIYEHRIAKHMSSGP
jgi:hypothetical protein